MDAETVSGFSQLFAGRHDAYGTDAGGCIRGDDIGGRVLERHLSGERPIGVYPMVEHWRYLDDNDVELDEPTSLGWFVGWGCVDFDIKSDGHPTYDFETEDEAHVAAQNVARVLERLGVYARIERTRSHGRHVWVFAEQPVPAATMRRALLVACSVAQVPTREINPKQEELGEGQLGNYVRLPYPGAQDSIEGRSRVMLWNGPGDWRQYAAWKLDTFVPVALDGRVNQRLLKQIAARWREPATLKIEHEITPYRGQLRDLAAQLDGLGYVMFRDGPQRGGRSEGLVILAHACARSHLSYVECDALLRDADARWGKFSERADRDKRLGEIVARAYG